MEVIMYWNNNYPKTAGEKTQRETEAVIITADGLSSPTQLFDHADSSSISIDQTAAGTPLLLAKPMDAFEIVPYQSYQLIDMSTHRALLEQSLREYKDIWRDLAQR